MIGDRYDCAGRQSSVLAYDYGPSEWLALGSGAHYERYGSEEDFMGRSLMAGAWYGSIDHADAALPLGEVLLLHEFSRNHLLAASTDGNGRVTAMRRIAPWAGVTRPIDVRVGPDGALFILEYEGSGATASPGPGLTRLEFSATGVFPDLPDSAQSDGTDGDGQGERSGWPQEADGPIDGQAVFQENCSGCHGPDAEGGTGPELVGVAERLSRYDLLAVVREGRRMMPAWEDELTDEQITAVADHLLALNSG